MEGSEIFVKFNKRGVKIKGGGGARGAGGISKYPLILVKNEKRDINV